MAGALCKRLSRLPDVKVHMLDLSEAGLYQTHKAVKFDERFAPLMGDIRSRDKLRALFDFGHYDYVIHAAALKHVHMLEHPLNM